jgi:hypothetical protein
MGRNYGRASEGGLRRRLILLVAIFACTYLFVTIQRGDWSVPRAWRDEQGPSVEQVIDAPRAAWRWASGVRVYDLGRTVLADLQKFATVTVPETVRAVAPAGSSAAEPPDRRPAP